MIDCIGKYVFRINDFLVVGRVVEMLEAKLKRNFGSIQSIQKSLVIRQGSSVSLYTIQYNFYCFCVNKFNFFLSLLI